MTHVDAYMLLAIVIVLAPHFKNWQALIVAGLAIFAMAGNIYR